MLALPGSDDSIRGLTVDAWIVADEAGRLPNDLIAALRPMRARRPEARFAMLVAHDVGRSRDRSTAVIGGLPAFDPNLIGIQHAHELPQGLYGSARASALATIDRHYESEGLIIADLSNDPTYAEVLFETFVIGLQITRLGDGMNFERRPVKNSAMLVYTVGRSHLLELFHSLLQSDQVRIADGPGTRRAYMSSLWRLKPKCARAGRSTGARQASTMISAYHVPCWLLRHTIRI